MNRIPVHQRISFKLARAALLIALSVGVLVSIVQVYLDYAGHRQEVAAIVTRILNAADPPAQRSILTLDTFLAQEVVNGLINYEFIANATIQDELGNVLANVSQPRRESSTRWLTTSLGDEFERFEVQLNVSNPSQQKAGRLTLVVDTDRAYSPFYQRALIVLTSGLLRNFIVVMLFLGFFYYMLTKPLLRIINDLARVDPNNPVTAIAALPRHHQNDELGKLRDTGNRLINTISIRMAELRRSNTALTANEQRFKDYTAAASDWFWEMDEGFHFVESPDTSPNRDFDPIDGWIGKTPWQVADADLSDPIWVALVTDLKAHREFRKFRADHLDPDGRHRKLEISGVPYFGEEGEFRGYRGVATDVTLSVKAEEQLAHSANLESLGRLTGGIAHDFNNLLAVIQGNLELLEEDLDEQDMSTDRVVSAIQATGRGSELTQQLLAIARSQNLVTKPINLNQLIARTKQMLSRVLESSVHIETHLADDLWTADIDISRMENVLINLALNSRDAMPAGGLLVVETGNITIDPDSSSHFGLDVVPGDYIRITVSDTGIGMPPEVQKRIFEPFYTTKGKGSGTGLGLSQIHGFIKQSGGYISVYSEPDNGTTIRLYLQRSHEEAQDVETTEPPKTELPELPDARVLIVEDDPDLRELALNIVQSLGLEVLACESGEEAVEIAKAADIIDLLLSDIVLTGQMTGRDVGTELARLYPGIGIIYMSGYAERALLHLGKSDPEAVLLQKPFQKKELINAIVTQLAGQKATVRH